MHSTSQTPIPQQITDAVVTSSQSSGNGSESSPSNFWATARGNARLRHQSPPIQRIPRDGDLALSFNQERLWYLEQMQPDNSVHNLQHILRFTGSLNLVALEQSLQEMGDRHEILRTTFSAVDGHPVQIIAPNVHLNLSLIDIQHLTPDEQEVKIQQLALEQGNQAFDLSQELLWRVQLLRLDSQHHVLIRTIHHIISDGWSHTIFIRELGDLYEAFSGEESSPLKAPPVQYADFAQTQRQWLHGEILNAQLTYWQQQLSGTVEPLVLPIDYPRSAHLSYQGASRTLVLSETLTEALKSFTYQQGVTLYVTLLAAFKLLLHQYTHQEDLVVCSPVAGRHRTEIKGLLGYFNNIVAMRTDLSGNPTFRMVLERVSQVSMGANEHQDTPFQVVSELPNLLRVPLTRAMFVLYNGPSPFSGFLPYSLELPNLTIQSCFVNRDVANFDLSFLAQEQDGRLHVIFQYKTDLFQDATIELMLQRFQELLELLVTNPEESLAALPFFQSLTDLHTDSTVQAANLLSETFVPPRTDLEQQLATIWEQLFNVHPIGVKDNFFERGGHSLLAVRLFAQIEQTLGFNLPLSLLLQAPTIELLAQAIDQESWKEAWNCLVPLQPEGHLPPLFLIHGGGVNVLIYRDLAYQLGPNQPVYALQAKGLDGQTAPHTTVEEMASDYITDIRAAYPEGPYYLAGLSHGGTIALEMAQQLYSQGQAIGLLALFDTFGPNQREFLPPIPRLWSILNYLVHYSFPQYLERSLKGESTFSIANLIKATVRKLGRMIQSKLSMSPPTHQLAHPLTDSPTDSAADSDPSNDVHYPPEINLTSDGTNGFTRWIHRFNIFVIEHSSWIDAYRHVAALSQVQGSQSQAVKELEIVHARANLAYDPCSYAEPVLLFRAVEQPPGFRRDPDYGWGGIFTGDVTSFNIPGNHTSIMQSPVLARHLKASLLAAQAAHGKREVE